jgi:hypothetical protein
VVRCPPIDRITRGRTRPGRLARLDHWLTGASAPVDLSDALVVDVGLGALPHTTVETFERLRAHAPDLTVLGIDTDPDRVQAAMPYADEGLTFALAGFGLRLHRPARLIRAMNVLRQYNLEQIADAHNAWGSLLEENGVLLEGSSNKTGSGLCCHVFRRRDGALVREGLLFSATFERGFGPNLFRDLLPKDIRRTPQGDRWPAAFFAEWTEAWKATGGGLAPTDAFLASVQRLAKSQPVDLRSADQGHVLWWVDGREPRVPAHDA